MKKEKIMMSLGMDLETFQAHLKRFQRKGYELHQLDVELMLQKTRDIYDQLMDLELEMGDTAVEEKAAPEQPKIIEKEVIAEPKAVEPPVVKEAAIEVPKPEITPPKEVIEAPIPEVVEKAEVIPEPIQKEVPPVKEVVEVTPPPTPVAEVKEQSPPPQEEAEEESPKNTIDLFSASAEATVSDQFNKPEEKSLAEKMQHAQVSDLRQEIGINEKFLFINELFGGDLGRYNKTIDELNELTTNAGIQAFLIELKVANQWQDDNEAYLKLKALLDRKLA